MQKQVTPDAPQEAGSDESQIEIDLRDPWLAAFLAWLIPGMGHFYQRRWAKGVLFSICILGTFLYGLAIGGGKVVYASFRPEDRRLQYVCQVGVGLVAMPAIVQTMRVRNGGEPWGSFMAPPKLMRGANGQMRSELDDWQEQLHRYFELGTVFTMIAGLLNILAIYDAWGGPVLIEVGSREKKENGKSPPDVNVTSSSRWDNIDYRAVTAGVVMGFFASIWVQNEFGPFRGRASTLVLAVCCILGAAVASGAYMLFKQLFGSDDAAKK
ncbi:MAG: hypothetical protein MI757_11145 [Pirellulales bacterium]|nr:hypothetical protein [Pirellulales bacterium]